LFAERMTLQGEPDPSYFRTFVQARHIFSFVTAGRMGWIGPWRDLVAETMQLLVNKAKRPDGFYVHRLTAGANHLDDRADLYDQAFVLFALGTAGGALGREDWFDQAEALLDRIEAEWAHPEGGFREGEIVDASIRRQNPHMHLLEAFLALHEASGRDRFLCAAKAIAELASTKFVDERSGALLEYFKEDWAPADGIEGRIAEPGHCFEWAWLFERMADAGWGRGTAISDQLTRFARRVGIDYQSGVAINEVLTDGTVQNGMARLWPQTERLKAAVARYRRLRSASEATEAAAAAEGLETYFDVPTPGLWRDKLQEDGGWVEELAPGSSLYHISCAYAELVTAGSVEDVSILEKMGI
jgi:mannose-6-phosphate isomerase